MVNNANTKFKVLVFNPGDSVLKDFQDLEIDQGIYEMIGNAY